MSHAAYLEPLDRERIFAVGFAGSREWSKDVHLLTTVLYFPSDTAEKIAIAMGVREIYFLALDLGNTAEKSHFFGKRPLQVQDRPQGYAQMRNSFERISGKRRGMRPAVYNCSPVSELKCFPYRSLREAVGP